jgi:hypothetical protein
MRPSDGAAQQAVAAAKPPRLPQENAATLRPAPDSARTWDFWIDDVSLFEV